MMESDNVEQVMTEISQSMNRFLKAASISELFIFAIIMGAIAGVVQGTARIVMGGFRK